MGDMGRRHFKDIVRFSETNLQNRVFGGYIEAFVEKLQLQLQMYSFSHASMVVVEFKVTTRCQCFQKLMKVNECGK